MKTTLIRINLDDHALLADKSRSAGISMTKALHLMIGDQEIVTREGKPPYTPEQLIEVLERIAEALEALEPTLQNIVYKMKG